MIAVPSLSTLSGQHEVARLSRLRAFFSEHPNEGLGLYGLAALMLMDIRSYPPKTARSHLYHSTA